MPPHGSDTGMIETTTSDGVCVLHLNAPPLNTMTFEMLDELRALIDRANADDAARGIVIIGDARHFSAGGDIHLLQEIACADDAVRLSRVFQETFQAVEDSSKPVAAAMAGRVLGGALELATACHVRVCTEQTTFRLPEVRLGINPGAGGTQRLPRLVGTEAALRMLLTAEALTAAAALELGLVDAVCEGEKLVETARDLVLSRPVARTSERTDKIGDDAANDAAFGKAVKRLARGRAETIAPREIVACVRAGVTESFEAGLAAEQQSLVRCMATPATRNRIYLFFATRQTSKAPDLEGVAASEISTTAVVGMGSMGTGIAHALIIAGLPVIVRDEDEAALQRGAARIRKSVEKRVASGKLAQDRAEKMLSLLTTTTAWEDLAGAEIVIEAVVENVEVKRAVLSRLEAVCSDETILATNTSTISLDDLAAGMTHGERLVGMHFFNPAHRMPLVEVIRRDATAPGAIATALALAKRLRKTPVLLRNREGFLVNRVFIPYLKEAFWCVQDGADPRAVDAAMVDFGFAMGPLALIDMAGLDILALTDEVMRRAFPSHGPISPIVTRLVEAGCCGQKTGSGVYRYEKGDYTPHDSDAARRIIGDLQQEGGAAPREVGADEITERLMLRMVNEALFAAQERIAQRESDVDVATVLGMGFPDFRGGILKYARDIGIDTVAGRLDALAEQFGERFRACGLLQEMKGS
jgi:3-hydroxyacyl-CoA dehydrogenase